MEKESREAGDDQQASNTHTITTNLPRQPFQSSTTLPQHDVDEESATQVADQTPQLEPSVAHQLNLDDISSPTNRHQVIAVSASKGPAAFFNLARKFLATDEFCDLSALEGAIVSAVDAAHLLERSKLADIVRIQTSYVPVEPKRKTPESESNVVSSEKSSTYGIQHDEQHLSTMLPQQSQHQGRKGGPLRRSRIIITVKRTEDYMLWLQNNPHQAAGHGDDIE